MIEMFVSRIDLEFQCLYEPSFSSKRLYSAKQKKKPLVVDAKINVKICPTHSDGYY